MKAILVEFSLMTRIVVPDSFDIDNLSNEDYEILRQKAVPNFHEKLNIEGIGDMLASIEEDDGMPYDESIELTEKELKILKNKPIGEYYQPSFYVPEVIKSLHSFEVFASKEIAQKAFPGVEILTYHVGDIEEPIFVDERYKGK